MGRFAESHRYLNRALAMVDPTGKKTQRDRALLLTNVALLYREEGQTAQAEELLYQAIAIEKEILPPGDARLVPTRAGLAELVLVDGKYQEAERLFVELLAIFEKQPDRWRQERGTIMGDLGVVRHFQGQDDEAIQLFRQAIAIHEAELGPDHPVLLRPLINLAKVHAAAGRTADADAVFRRAVAIAERGLGPDHPTYSDVLIAYAGFLRATGHPREAKALEARSKSARQENARRDGIGLTVDASSFWPRPGQ
jgi:tetratricopeptide (TPR) repeat protein